MLTRDHFSLRSICRELHEPPPLKRDCCIRVPEEIVKNPDPATYDVDRVFAGGGTPTFNSPDISTVHVWPMRPIDNLIAIIRNLSAAAGAQRTRVGTVNLSEIVFLNANRDTRKRPVSGHLQRLPISSEARGLLKLTVPYKTLIPDAPEGE